MHTRGDDGDSRTALYRHSCPLRHTTEVVRAHVGLPQVVVLPARPDLQFETQGAAAAIRAALPKAIVEVPDVPLDLASYESVRAFGEHMRTGGSTIDVLCLNAARGGSESDKAEVTADDHEATMQVNLLSHALLVHELLPNLRRSSNARIVVHSSGTRTNAQQSSLDDLVGKRRSTNPFSQYILSKAGLCLFARAVRHALLALTWPSTCVPPGTHTPAHTTRNDTLAGTTLPLLPRSLLLLP